jgi:hypothetical protein
MKDGISTWQYLPKGKKEALTWLKPKDMQHLIQKKQFGKFYELHSTLAILRHEGMDLSEDMKDCLLYPFTLAGDRAFHLLSQYKRDGDHEQPMDGWLTKRMRDALQQVHGDTAAELIKEGDIDLLTQWFKALQNLETTHGLNDDQRDFMELAQSYV